MANFPLSKDDFDSLFNVTDRATSSLATDFNLGDASIIVTDGDLFPSGRHVVTVDDEQVIVASRSGNVLTVEAGGRGAFGTPVTAHSFSTQISVNMIAGIWNTMTGTILDMQETLWVWRLPVLSRAIAIPPGAVSTGDSYIVASGGVSAWLGRDGDIATFNGSAWDFVTPELGFAACVADEGALVFFDGSAWKSAGSVNSVFGRSGDITAESGDYNAGQISFDNVESGLTATDAQSAIDEVAARVAPLETAPPAHSHTVGDITDAGTMATQDANSVAITGGTISGATVDSRNVGADGAKLDGIAAGATANATDAFLLDRGNHTGTQPVSTIDGLSSALGDASSHAARTDNPHAVTKAQVGLGNVSNDAQIPLAQKGAPNGVAELDATGKVPAAQLPSYVDDVLEVPDYTALPITGEAGKLYVTINTNVTYRWSGTTYVEISASVALGETADSAYRGDRGKIAYDHSQQVGGNPHGVTKSEVGLGNVDNTSDASKPVSTAQQTALDTKVDKVAGYGLSEEDFTSTLLAKVNGIAAGATANSSDSVLLDRANHTGEQAISTVTGLQGAIDAKVDVVPGKQLSTEDYTTLEKTKLAGIEDGATANSTDAFLLDRSNHTGTQPISSIEGLQAELDGGGAHAFRTDNPHGVTKAQVGLGNVTNQAQIPLSEKGSPNGVAELDATGKVPAAQLPSYVDEVVEFATAGDFPATGIGGVIYIATDTNKTYRWTGTLYVAISSDVALGETASTAYRGDRGKIAYDHSQAVGNPHGTTKADIGLGNVDNVSSASLRDRSTHTGTQTLATISNAGTAAGLNAGSSIGNVLLIENNAGTPSLPAIDGSRLLNIGGGGGGGGGSSMEFRVRYISDGFFIVPAGIYMIWVTAIGGGGGGASGTGAVSTNVSGGGVRYGGNAGKNGAACLLMPVRVTPGDNFPITIGRGGAGGVQPAVANTNVAGVAGGTTIAGNIILPGGEAGENASTSIFTDELLLSVITDFDRTDTRLFHNFGGVFSPFIGNTTYRNKDSDVNSAIYYRAAYAFGNTGESGACYGHHTYPQVSGISYSGTGGPGSPFSFARGADGGRGVISNAASPAIGGDGQNANLWGCGGGGGGAAQSTTGQAISIGSGGRGADGMVEIYY
ncbi:DUF2793 domain-containing protein [Roseibium aggregatum]|uniref:Uncharacterized protein n=1 Tax=Roseibium aggregatum TaxID=187304 RepID=A0A0M6Y8M0_9HYPH|nr:DUF2793 domain-containing protein [Roseibium aggregatum]CTQ45759.1 hypothetical protein LAL4801_04214 [Roseibium aggregatum]